jgi:DNA recombination-mediator protein A
VVAEAPLGTAPIAKHFPKRKRVIAGLTLGLVVVEAAVRSGSRSPRGWPMRPDGRFLPCPARHSTRVPKAGMS